MKENIFSDKFLQQVESQFGFSFKCYSDGTFFENNEGDRFQIFGEKINPKLVYVLCSHYYRRDRHYR